MEEIFFETQLDKSYENTEFNEKISVSPCLEIPTEKETKEKIRIFNGLKYDIISIYELKDYLGKTNHILYDIIFESLSKEHKEFLLKEKIKITKASRLLF